MQYSELYTSFVESEFYKKAIDCKEEYNLEPIFKDFLKSNECSDEDAFYLLVIIFLKKQNMGDRLQKFFSQESYHLNNTSIENFIEIGFNVDYILNLLTGKAGRRYGMILPYLDRYIEYGISHDNLLKVVKDSILRERTEYYGYKIDFIIKSLYKLENYGVNFNLLDANFLMDVLLFADDKIISCLIEIGVDFSKVNQPTINNSFIDKKIELLNSLNININKVTLLRIYNDENRIIK